MTMEHMTIDHLPASRSWPRALWRGFWKHCPNCGKGKLFTSYVTVAPACSHCQTSLHHQRADDAPPYFTILAVGHIIVPAMLVVEKLWHPPLWLQFGLWLPLTLALSISLLPMFKGLVVGLQWALRLHGFAEADQP